ncbi:hypothetical protein BGW36DRAFT_368356 [Talaromyces proteolyticus]|uniref:Mitochondrial intermembrane space import and assembly protein 40 n=1 Tax=Talaromyces proteolyticus TaxID=1131652 RepID=A0AAD4L3G3_9EURO|nr:uncharacterized protein BGW36DRAFT_368356 [Talaromyces proteolyticus]KAH8705900.1 hypothetical protein BGW36DRAFT_368356 [Talaromyces proteolyticus]
MLRQATARRAGLLLRNTNTSTVSTAFQRRLASTNGSNPIVPPPPSQKQRSWRNRLVRLGFAGAAIYYYNTSSVFADEQQPRFSLFRSQPVEDAVKVTPVAEQKQQQIQSSSTATKSEDASQPNTAGEGQGLEDLESQAGTEGAFNPETGEINWDCPCLGGMAHGPCGEEFREAFSCFVYSTEEPKGMDCIEKFKGMQDCFRLHPDVYGAELEEDEVDEQLTEQIAQRDREDQARKDQQQPPQETPASDPASASLNEAEKRAEVEEIRKANVRTQDGAQEEESLVPRAWHESEGEDLKKTEN